MLYIFIHLQYHDYNVTCSSTPCMCCTMRSLPNCAPGCSRQPPAQHTGAPTSTTPHTAMNDDVTTNNQTSEPTSPSGDLRLLSDVAHQLPGELKTTRREEREGGSAVMGERGGGEGGGGGGVKRSDENIGREQRADMVSVQPPSVKKHRLVGPALPPKRKRDMRDTQVSGGLDGTHSAVPYNGKFSWENNFMNFAHCRLFAKNFIR